MEAYFHHIPITIIIFQFWEIQELWDTSEQFWEEKKKIVVFIKLWCNWEKNSELQDINKLARDQLKKTINKLREKFKMAIQLKQQYINSIWINKQDKKELRIARGKTKLWEANRLKLREKNYSKLRAVRYKPGIVRTGLHHNCIK